MRYFSKSSNISFESLIALVTDRDGLEDSNLSISRLSRRFAAVKLKLEKLRIVF